MIVLGQMENFNGKKDNWIDILHFPVIMESMEKMQHSSVKFWYDKNEIMHRCAK